MCFELDLSISWCWTLHLPFDFGNSYFSVWKTFLYYFLSYVLPFIFFDLLFCNFYHIEIEISIILIANFTYPFSAIIISIFKISIEFFISAIKTLISKNSFLFSEFYSFLFSEFWGQKSHLYIFIEYFFSFFPSLSLSCWRLSSNAQGCFVVHSYLRIRSIWKLCVHGLPQVALLQATIIEFFVRLFCFLNWALPKARLCRSFLWGGLIAPKNNFLISWIEQFKHSH